jgi:secreted trypsin-like serine protease
MKSSGVFAILLAGLGLAACAPTGKVLKSVDGQILNIAESSPFNIINGKDVEPTDEFGASIAGIYNLENNSLCTGSLIADSYVLTAAHCVGHDPRNLRVFFGKSLDTIVAINKVSAAVIPNIYGERFKEQNDWGDIAVLKIEGNLPTGYKPIQMLPTDSLQEGQDTVIAGYGLSDGVKKEGSGFLRKTSVAIANPKHGISEASLDQRNGTGACHGDSGGPAYLLTESGYALWGVTSRGLNDPEDHCSQFAVYTNAVAYRDFITQARMKLLGL